MENQISDSESKIKNQISESESKIKNQKNINEEYLPQKKDQLLKHPFRLAAYGVSNSGKSHEISRILMDQRYGLVEKTFPVNNIWIISPTINEDDSQNKLIQYLKYKSRGLPQKDQFNEDIQVTTDPNQFIDKIKQICDQQNQNKKDHTNKPALIIADDILGVVNLKSGYFPSLLTKLRHSDCSMIMSVQYLKNVVSPMLRAQITHWMLFPVTSNSEYKKIQQDLSGIKYVKNFGLIFDEATRDKYGYLFINLSYPEQYRYFKTIDYQFQI